MPNYRYQQGDQPLEGYTIQYALGRGGFGEVYFGVSDAGREVALKAVQNYEDVELRGISHCMNLKSPHLVTIFDVRRGQGGVPWVIMEYVSGPSLNEVLTEAGSQGIGEDQAMFFTRELIKGLRYLHDAGVVHRDLKPHNIFFEDGTIKIGDYSLSKAISQTQQTGHTTTVGSVHYMAPEIGEGKYDKSVDIYALGIILFEMLTGSPPYVGESMTEVLIKHLTSEPDVSQLSQPFADVIRKAMKRDPNERFASVDEMLLALCPTDHSSYLAPPTSLTMIGERAAKNRSKQNQAALAGRAHQLGGLDPSLTDTFLPVAKLIDTKENKPDFFDAAKIALSESQGLAWLTSFFNRSDIQENEPSSDSLPFSRPGVSLPTLNWLRTAMNWLSVPGLYWRPTGKQLAGSDTTPIAWRAIVALQICIALIALAGIFGPVDVITHPRHKNPILSVSTADFLVLAPLLVLLAAGLTWALRQFLPRSQKLRWTIASRIIGYGLVFLAGLIVGTIAMELGHGEPPFYLAESAQLFIPLSALIDWRCFISADRYPRVGLTRTVTVVILFLLACSFDPRNVIELNPSQLILPLMTLTGLVISIQLLAPQHRAKTTEVDVTGEAKPTPASSEASVDPAIANTRALLPEIDVVKETV